MHWARHELLKTTDAPRREWSRWLSATLALLLVALGLFVRSESAHDAYHRARADRDHASDGHFHSHADTHSHSHDHGSGDPVRHEHTAPLIDLLAEQLVETVLVAVDIAAFNPVLVYEPDLVCLTSLDPRPMRRPRNRAPPVSPRPCSHRHS